MKRSILSLAAALVIAGGITACANQDETGNEPETVAVDGQEIVTGAIGPLFWPTAPITWLDGVGTWPIAISSPAALDMLVFDIPGVSMLDVTFTTLDGVLLTGFPFTTIDPLLVDTWMAGPWLGGLYPAYGMLPWLNGLGALPYYGAPGYVYGLNYYPGFVGAGCAGCALPPLTPIVGDLAFPGLFPAGLLPVTTAGLLTPTLLPSATFLTPMLTTNALFFDTLPFIGATTPFIANVSFAGLNAASMASLNIMTTSMATSMATSSAMLQATLFPIMGIPFL